MAASSRRDDGSENCSQSNSLRIAGSSNKVMSTLLVDLEGSKIVNFKEENICVNPNYSAAIDEKPIYFVLPFFVGFCCCCSCETSSFIMQPIFLSMWLLLIIKTLTPAKFLKEEHSKYRIDDNELFLKRKLKNPTKQKTINTFRCPVEI